MQLLLSYRYCSNPDFNPDVIKSASTACEGLCKWVRAMEVYDRVAKVVAPKKAKLAEAEAELSVQMAKLNEKRAELQAVLGEEKKLQKLNKTVIIHFWWCGNNIMCAILYTGIYNILTW